MNTSYATPSWQGPSTALVPTAEQAAIVATFVSGEYLKVLAFAGTGKTSTLSLMTHATGRRGLAIVFNKAAEEELKRRLAGACESRTMHSLAWGYCRKAGYPAARLNANFVAAWYPPLKAASQLFKETIAKGLRYFHQSADPFPELKHIPDPNRLVVGTAAKMPSADAAAWRDVALAWVRGIWQEQQSGSSTVPIGGDGYIKLWAVSNPIFPADYLLCDESQDVNPVIHGVIAAQRCQVVIVGDPHQQLYAWRGASDAMAAFNWRALPLTQSWRFGPELAALASGVLRMLGEVRPLLGNPSRSTVITDDGHADAILCRTNAGCFGEASAFMLDGRSVYADSKLVSALKALTQDVCRLQAGMPAETAELLGLTTFRELQEFSETDEGMHLKTLVGLVTKYGTDGLSRLLSSFAREPAYGVATVSTTHRAKGLEWGSVRLGSDFRRGHQITDEERRLFYVAITRAKDVLVVEPELLDEYQNPTPPPPPPKLH